ncbi:ribonuclease H-like domain-containing protein [Glomus cerebriforme]|uniref:Ribonuclease H-like domain-containing protein n=1 Tax=Glomus cerebriforme TaxID=658196 RepID=A0A397SWU9_9GLOM|nr:ribonuclease H-like domain-containing protein [Glomus cerebriforme]
MVNKNSEDNSINSESQQQPALTFSNDNGSKEDNNNKKNDGIKKEQSFQYYLCFDVEATCEKGKGFEYKNEIIEFPIILIESKTFETVDIFHSYVKPSIRPILSDFCKELTGISQKTIDESPSFPEMIINFQEFLHKHQLFYENTCAFITDGPWDIRDFIEKQCKISQIGRPSYFSIPWVDIRTLFSKFYDCKKVNIDGMLSRYGLEFKGHKHSGIDDVKNLAIIAKKMWEDGAIFDVNDDLSRWNKSRNHRRKKYKKK